MRRSAVIATALIASVGALVGAADPPKADVAPDHVARLIQQLGSPRYAERESASAALDALGDAALPVLQSAANSADAEIRGRAAELVERIVQRAAVAKLLKPTLVTLKFNNTPLEDAVKSLAASSGLRIELARAKQWSNRTVSVVSGPLPIWEAIELFCRKADVHEWDGVTPIPNSPPAPTAAPQPNVVFGGIQGQVFVNGRVSRIAGSPEPKIVLLDGPNNAIASHDAGAVRLRLMPPDTPFPLAAGGGETLLPIHVAAEPRLRWAGVLSVRIDRAIDEFGTERAVSGVVAPIANVDDVEWMMMANGVLTAVPATGLAGPAALKVSFPDRAAKTVLKEIAGEVTARVAVTEALAQLDGPLKAGLSVEGGTGVSIKITDVATPGDGELRLSIDLHVPPDIQPMGPLAAGMNNRMGIAGGVVIQQRVAAGGKPAAIPALPSGTTEYNGLTVEDQQGRRWTATRAVQESVHFTVQGLVAKLVVIVRPPAPDSTAARLVFSGSRPTTIAVPFRFRDVTLR